MHNGKNQAADLWQALDRWLEHGWIRPLDRAFVDFLRSQEPDSPMPVLLAAVLVSHQLGRGHVCLDLDACLARTDETLSLPPEGVVPDNRCPGPETLFRGLTLASWTQCIDETPLVETSHGTAPLVLDGNRLYMRRFWVYTRYVAETILHRTRFTLPVPADLAVRLDRRFEALRSAPEREKSEVHWQSVAAALAVKSAFCVISGGPGTGKTTTVVHLLALLQELALEQGEKLRIALAAPTGKAAARLTESIGTAAGSLPEALRETIPLEASTLHRLLGGRPGTRHFSHNGENPLHLDLLAVDEASMIDLEMMASLLSALPEKARLILLGDKDQLASVEAGSVLGDLCRHVAATDHPAPIAQWIFENTGYTLPVSGVAQSPLAAHVAVLHKSHRFDHKSGIGELACAVNSGMPDQVASVWNRNFEDIDTIILSGPDDRRLERLVLDGRSSASAGEEKIEKSKGYRRYLERLAAGIPDGVTEDRWLKQILDDFGRFQLLTPLHKGPWGRERLNQKIAEALFRHGLIGDTKGWYPGRPVMLTCNDYSLGLMNGDTGIAILVGKEKTREEKILKVVFPMADGTLKKVLPSRLGHVETVYAMTVHKSQGSEFDHTVLVLPDRSTPLVTRELIYTAVTRSKTLFTLACPDERLMEDTVRRRIHRASGLGDLLQSFESVDHPQKQV